MAVPNKVLYLDCLVVGPETFEVSWGLPVISSDANDGEYEASLGVIDTTVTNVVIQYRDRGERKRLKWKNLLLYLKVM